MKIQSLPLYILYVVITFSMITLSYLDLISNHHIFINRELVYSVSLCIWLALTSILNDLNKD